MITLVILTLCQAPMACHQLLENEYVKTQDSLQGRVGQTKGWSAGDQFLILAIVSAWMLLRLNEEEWRRAGARSKLLERGDTSGSRVLIISRFAARGIPFLQPSSSHSLFMDQCCLAFFAPILTLSPQGLNDYPDALLVAEGSLRSSLVSSGIGGLTWLGSGHR